jgi:hypothetical protein
VGIISGKGVRVRIRLGPGYQEYTDNREILEVEGNTVKECLESLVALFPVFKDLLSDSDHALSSLVICNGEVIVPSQLDRSVADCHEISLLPMIYGG